MNWFRPSGKFAEGSTGPRLLAQRAGETVGKRWRFRRNLVIYVAFKNGFSQRLLSDVFDLPRSRIASIIKEVSVIDESMDTNRDNTSQ